MIVDGREKIQGSPNRQTSRRYPCIIKRPHRQEALILQIIENLQREDLNPVEEAKSIQETYLENRLDPNRHLRNHREITTLHLPNPENARPAGTHPRRIRTGRHPKRTPPSTNEIGEPGTAVEGNQAGKTAGEIKKEVEKEKPPRGRPKITGTTTTRKENRIG